MPKKIKHKKKQEKKSNEQTVIRNYFSFLEWERKISVSVSNSKGIKWFLLILLPLIVLVYYPACFGDYDIWWHLKLGEHYVKNLTMEIDHSIFSWTPADPGWIYNTWLGSTIFYLAYIIASGFGLKLIQWSIFTGLFLLYFFYIKSINDTLDINYLLGFLLLAIALNSTLILYKPENFTVLFFALTVFVYFYCKSSSKKLFFLYPIFFIIWVNLHGGFLVGIFFISVTLSGEIANYAILKKGQMPKYLLVNFAIYGAISYIALLINPYGIHYLIYLLKNMFLKGHIDFAGTLLAYENLWRFLFPSKYYISKVNTAWVIVIMGTLFFFLSLYGYRKKRYFDITLFIINAIFFYLGMSTGRYSIFFPILSFFSILYLLKKAEILYLKTNFAFIALLFFLFCAGNVVFTNLCFTYTDYRHWFGQGMDQFIPVKEVEFIKKHKIQPPLFNDYLVGGYMIWSMYPEYKVFIDSRYGPYWKQVARDYMNLNQNPNSESIRQFTAKYPFKAAFIGLYAQHLIFALLGSEGANWRILFFDKNAIVIIHKSLISSLGPEALAIDMSPEKFENLKDPEQLMNLFSIYETFDPKYGRKILDIYKKNVSQFYWYKKRDILRMEQSVFRATQQREIRDKAKNAPTTPATK